MNLKDLLEPEVVIPSLLALGPVHRLSFNKYYFFDKEFSYVKDNFKSGEIYLDTIKSNEDNRDLIKIASRMYESVLNFREVPIIFKISRPFYYSKTKKEISELKEKSKKGLCEINSLISSV